MSTSYALKRSAAPPELDHALIWVSVLLVGIGLVMVYSASIAIAEGGRFTGGQSTYFLIRHCIALAISVLAALVAFQVPLRLWQQAAPYLFMLGAALLVLVLIPDVRREVNGSRRWLPLVVMNLQPSELMKLLEGKDVMVGVIDVASEEIETPEQVADTIGMALQYVPKHRLIACTNCGLAPMSREVAMAKLQALGAGAALARQRYGA